MSIWGLQSNLNSALGYSSVSGSENMTKKETLLSAFQESPESRQFQR